MVKVKERQAQTGKNIFAKHMSDKELVSKIYKEPLNSTIRKQTTRL